MTAPDPAQDPAPVMRIGDRERRATDERLRAALDDGVLTVVEYDERAQQCWASRTQRELDALVVDLPAPTAPAPFDAPTTVSPSGSHPPASRPWHERLGRAIVPLALLGAVGFGASQLIGADHGSAVFGNRTVAVAPGDDEVEVAVLFGSTQVVVPDGVLARSSGFLVFGGVDCEEACRLPPGAPTLPEVDVDASGAFGSVDVVTASEAARGGIDRDRDRGDDDD